ncbi:MAG: sugar transferase [Alloprevotella sp.]|nr:sugar transferase [Alloprevotella sp.]
MEQIPAQYRYALTPTERGIKRLFDIVASILGLIIFAIPILICYVLIKREDGGPAIFKQERVGRNGKLFHILKFRSMRIDSEKEGPQLSEGDIDLRLLKCGRYLRATHLDEIPQLLNVLWGDMSFVGPRPERLYYINLIKENDARYDYILQMRPGLTSFATIYNGYTHTMEEMLRRLRYDLFYLTHASFGTDLLIIFRTVQQFITSLFQPQTEE